MSAPDPRDLLQTTQDEPVPVLRSVDAPPTESPDVRRKVAPLSPLGKRLQVLLSVHAAAARFRMWQWIWWGIRALVVIGVSIPLCLSVGHAAYRYMMLQSPHYSTRTAHHPVTGQLEYYIKGEKATAIEYDFYLSTEPQIRHQADVVGWGTGLGAAASIALLWAMFEWCWKRRHAALEEQIAGIQRDFAPELAAWGGPAVLREPAAVAQILRLESAT